MADTDADTEEVLWIMTTHSIMAIRLRPGGIMLSALLFQRSREVVRVEGNKERPPEDM